MEQKRLPFIQISCDFQLKEPSKFTMLCRFYGCLHIAIAVMMSVCARFPAGPKGFPFTEKALPALEPTQTPVGPGVLSQGCKGPYIASSHTYKIRHIQLLDISHQTHSTWSHPITGPDGPSGFQEVETPIISRQSANEGGKVVSPTHWPSLTPGRIPGTCFC
jgi:hypothetical protein